MDLLVLLRLCDYVNILNLIKVLLLTATHRLVPLEPLCEVLLWWWLGDLRNFHLRLFLSFLRRLVEWKIVFCHENRLLSRWRRWWRWWRSSCNWAVQLRPTWVVCNHIMVAGWRMWWTSDLSLICFSSCVFGHHVVRDLVKEPHLGWSSSINISSGVVQLGRNVP